jgi:hypothetical protein
MNKQKKIAGILLLEIVFSLAILTFFMPIIFKTYLYVQKKVFIFQENITYETENIFINSFINSDIRLAKTIVSASDNYLKFITSYPDSIEYSLNKTRIRRRKNSNSTFYLNSKVSVTELSFILVTAQLLQISYKTNKQPKTSLIYLPLCK